MYVYIYILYIYIIYIYVARLMYMLPMWCQIIDRHHLQRHRLLLLLLLFLHSFSVAPQPATGPGLLSSSLSPASLLHPLTSSSNEESPSDVVFPTESWSPHRSSSMEFSILCFFFRDSRVIHLDFDVKLSGAFPCSIDYWSSFHLTGPFIDCNVQKFC